MEDIIAKDKALLVYLNNLGAEQFDGFWLFITNQFYLAPIFLLVFYLLYRKVGWKNLGLILLFLALIIMVCDQTTNVVKYSVQRLRPVNDLQIKDQLRILLERSSFSFFSGHASNSMACTVFLFLVSRKLFKYGFLLFLFPLIFAYSRVYLGLHFPGDILVGYLFGILTGAGFYWLYKRFGFFSATPLNKKALFTIIGCVLIYFVICTTITAQLK